MMSKNFSQKKILLADKSDKKINDRTWCFWEKEKGFFETLVSSQWNKLWFHSNANSALMPIAPFEYKMIRGIDFYDHCFEMLHKYENIHFVRAEVEKIESNEKETFALINGEKLNAEYIFNSIIFEKPSLSEKQFFLLQHFKGWLIDTTRDSFNPAEAILMDFRTSQQQGTSFFYVMPFSEKTALVEYTVFSEKLLDNGAYDDALKQYLQKRLHVDSYIIREEEFGAIPMTNFNFHAVENNILNIGTAGGTTKASSGYTFQFIQKNSEAIIKSMIATGRPAVKTETNKFKLYDSIFLNVLATKKISGEKIFEAMFTKNRAPDIFDFLDNESNLSQDIKIIRSLPAIPFLKAALQQIF
jgi:lycopene beta-cyclase